MKTKPDHIVSLPRQAVAMLEEMRHISHGNYVFPAIGKLSKGHIHRDSLSKAMSDMGFQGIHTPHAPPASLHAWM